MPFERFLHFLVVTSFLLLVITGMPLKFYYASWAKALFSIIGGAEAAQQTDDFGPTRPRFRHDVPASQPVRQGCGGFVAWMT